MEEAKEAMYDYLIKRDNVTKQDLKNNETVKAYQELAESELREGGYTIQTTITIGSQCEARLRREFWKRLEVERVL